MKKTIVSLSLFGLMFAAPPAHAIFGISEEVLAIIRNISQQVESMRVVASQRVVAEGIAEWQENREAEREAIRLKRAYEQPETTCGSLAAADTMPKVEGAVKASVSSRGRDAVNIGYTARASEPGGTQNQNMPVHAVTNSSQQIIKTYDHIQTNFCTEADQALGRCKQAQKYPGGDIRADLLFGGPTGGETQAADQGPAVDAFINHLVDSMGPEVLRNPQWDKTVEGRKYVMMVRQYAAYMSLARHSLQMIDAQRKPIRELGNISKMESVNQYIATKWSADAIKDRAVATDPVFMLRDIAMMNSFNLWLAYQTLQGSDRQEALLSAQLALSTRQVYGAPLAAQRAVASGAGG